MSQLCYCRSALTFARCCQPYLTDALPAPTPEALMRSRYSAFCSGNIEYLVHTHHPNYRSPEEAQLLRQTIADTHWLGLNVLHHLHDGDKGEVEFIAYFGNANAPQQLHERSQFMREAGQWFYLDGEQLPALKIQRNDPCYCGSGNKFKKCCAQS